MGEVGLPIGRRNRSSRYSREQWNNLAIRVMGMASNVNPRRRLHKLVQIPVIPGTDKELPEVQSNNKKADRLKINLVEERESLRNHS